MTNKKPLASGEELRALLPQRPPMVMIDALTGCDDDTTETTFTVRAECVFVDPDPDSGSDACLNAYGLTENVAQTCAARLGWLSAQAGAAKPPLGFIGAVKDVEVHALPPVGETIRTTVTVAGQAMGMTLVDAVVRDSHGTILLNATMKIAIIPD